MLAWMLWETASAGLSTLRFMAASRLRSKPIKARYPITISSLHQVLQVRIYIQKAPFCLARFDTSFRSIDCHLYKSRVGYQDTYAINIIKPSWSVYVHVRWRTTNHAIRGDTGLLSWIGPINLWGFARSSTVYGLRTA